MIRQLDLFDLDGGFSYSSCNSLGTPQRSLCTSDAIPTAQCTSLQQNDKHTRRTTKIREFGGKCFIWNKWQLLQVHFTSQQIPYRKRQKGRKKKNWRKLRSRNGYTEQGGSSSFCVRSWHRNFPQHINDNVTHGVYSCHPKTFLYKSHKNWTKFKRFRRLTWLKHRSHTSAAVRSKKFQ